MSTLSIQHLSLALNDSGGLITEAWNRLSALFAAPSAIESVQGRLMIKVGDRPDRPTHVEQLEHQSVAEVDGFAFEFGRSGARRRFAVPGAGVADFDFAAGWAEIDCRPDASAAVRWFLLFRTVCESLAVGGHCFVHASCLAMPSGDGWSGVVLSAPSNTGKTTTALSLTRSGWRLLGDDITYVRPPQLESRVWGFPRACHLRPGTLRMLPWLNDLQLGQLDSTGVRSLSVDQLGGGAGSAWLDPALVVLLDRPNPRETKVEPLDRAAALSLLAAESLTAIPGVCDSDSERDFLTLGRLACVAKTCRMSVGPDPSDVAERLQDFLAATRRRHHAA